MKTHVKRMLAYALVGSVALGVGSGCTGFWAASAPESAPKQEMEKAEPIEDDDGATADDEAPSDSDSAMDDTDSDMGSTGSGSAAMGSSDTGSTGMAGSGDDTTMEAMKMTVSAMSPQTASADLYWDVADNTAMGTKEVKLQLVSADSGAEMKACREIKVSADQQSFMGKRVGVEVEKRAERLTTYLPQDALDKLAAANTVTVFVCEYKFLLDGSQKSKLGDLRDRSGDSESGVGSNGSSMDTGSEMDDGVEDVEESSPGTDSGGMDSTSDY